METTHLAGFCTCISGTCVADDFGYSPFGIRMELFVGFRYGIHAVNLRFEYYSILSYDVAVFQWIRSCNKSVMTTPVLTLLWEYATTLTTSVTPMLIFTGNMSTLKAVKSYLRSHIIKRILHSWSFHMKFIKHAECSFNKFHMK